MVSDEEFAPDFIDAVSAGGVVGWRHMMVANPLHPFLPGLQAKVLIDETGPIAKAWMLSPEAAPMRPGFVVGRGCNVVKG